MRESRSRLSISSPRISVQVLDLLALAEKTMPADVEAIAVGLDCPGESANEPRVRFEHGAADAVPGQFVGSGQPGGPGTHDDHMPLGSSTGRAAHVVPNASRR